MIIGAIVCIIISAVVHIIIEYALKMEYERKKRNKDNDEKIKELYPYYSYKWYKKIFLLGTNGALNKVAIILNYLSLIINISLFVMLVVSICITSPLLSNIIKYTFLVGCLNCVFQIENLFYNKPILFRASKKGKKIANVDKEEN